MNKIMLFLLMTMVLSCNTYEVPHPNVKVNIHVINKEDGEVYAGYKGVIRTSNFSLANTSTFFREDTESVRYDSSYSSEHGDLSFDIPFVNGVPQKYYELTLFKDSELPVTEGHFLDEYVQYDTLRIGSLTQLDVNLRNDSCRLVSFSTLGYQTEADYKRDSADIFLNPDYIARLGTTEAKTALISKTVPFECNKIMVLQVIDRSTPTPLMIKYDVIEMEKDSIKVHDVKI